MRIEVDQSGKVENTGVDTVLVFADDESYVILVPAAANKN